VQDGARAVQRRGTCRVRRAVRSVEAVGRGHGGGGRGGPGYRCGHRVAQLIRSAEPHGKAPEGGTFRRGADQANETVLLAVLAFLAILSFLAVLAFLATLGFLAVLAFLALVLLVLVLLSAFLTILVCHCRFSLLSGTAPASGTLHASQ